MRMLKLAVAIVAVATISADQAPLSEVTHSDVGRTISITGILDRPVGEMLTIRGEKVYAPKGMVIDFEVNAVNGTALKQPMRVNIHGIVDWPLGTKAEIRGQEVGKVTYTDI